MKKGKTITWTAFAALAAAGGYFAWSWFFPAGAEVADLPTRAVERGDLLINVLQGGEIRALQNLEIKSEIEIPTKILSLIPEGYLITEEDVKNGKVLIELDDTEVKQKI